jgi:hypothetical protein
MHLRCLIGISCFEDCSSHRPATLTTCAHRCLPPGQLIVPMIARAESAILDAGWSCAGGQAIKASPATTRPTASPRAQPVASPRPNPPRCSLRLRSPTSLEPAHRPSVNTGTSSLPSTAGLRATIRGPRATRPVSRPRRLWQRASFSSGCRRHQWPPTCFGPGAARTTNARSARKNRSRPETLFSRHAVGGATSK